MHIQSNTPEYKASKVLEDIDLILTSPTKNLK